MLQLCFLIAITVAAFFLTSAVAASNRRANLRDAADWYRRGQDRIAAGQLDDAIVAFRRAVVRDRTDKRYSLALAHALALDDHNAEARRTLLVLRESEPEDREINLELARVAAKARDVTGALRFYHNALYAPWPVDQTDARRRLRLELIGFLIATDQDNRAQSEVFALSSDIPDDAPHHVEVARLFAETGDQRRALDQFRRALQVERDNPDALEGAGQSAFRLGDYRAAEDYLRRVPADRESIQDARAIAGLVMTSDPWAPRIGSVERRRRLLADFSHARARLEECLRQRSRTPSTEDAALQTDARTFADRLNSQRVVEQDTIEAGFDLIGRLERATGEHCGAATPLDRALVLIERQHGGESR